ncbi:MAG: ABC transporter substrate-binding protein [Acidimicrobiia bacterium]
MLAIAVAGTTAGCGRPVVESASQEGQSVASSGDSAGAAPIVEGAAEPEASTPGQKAAASVGKTSTGAGYAPAKPSGKSRSRGSVASAGASTGTGSAKSPVDKSVKGATAPAPAIGGSPLQSLIASAPIFGGKAACRPATLSDVNIGNVSTLSGVLGELFAPISASLETFVTSQNACGGLNGHRIRFFQSDDQGDPATAVAKVQEMIQRNKVIAFVGNIQVLTIDAVVPTIKKFGIPIIGGNLSSNTWFTNPLIFPQGSNQLTISYSYLEGAAKYHKVKSVGHIWCIEVPKACGEINRGMYELAPKFGVEMKRDIQVSITAPSYVQPCLDFKSAGVEALALSIDAASMKRLGRSCIQVGYHPKLMAPPLSLGNEKQFLGGDWLGNTFVPMNVFPWMGNSTPVEKYFQASVRKFNPGFQSGGAAALGWSSGALLVAAAAGLSETNPTTQQLLDTLWTFKGQPFTKLGGLSPAPLTFQKDGNPKVPYCYYAAVSNEDNSGWAKVISEPNCTDVLAPSDPQRR